MTGRGAAAGASPLGVQAPVQLLVGGEPMSGAGLFDVVNPATGVAIGQAPECDLALAERVVAGARRAQGAWEAQSPTGRRTALAAWCDRMAQHAPAMGDLLGREGGRLLARARQELQTALRSARAALQAPTAAVPESGLDGLQCQLHRQALGVVVLRADEHEPVASVWPDAVQALQAGNAVVLVASSYAPLTLLWIGTLAADLLPRGVLSVVCGGPVLGPWLQAHRDVAPVRAGPLVAERHCAIVLDDAPADAAARCLFEQAFTAGQRDRAPLRFVFVHRDLHSHSANLWVDLAKAARPQMEPLPGWRQRERAAEALERAAAQGLRFLTGGTVMAGTGTGTGCFVAPVVLDNPPVDAYPLIEQLPCAAIALIRFHDLDDVVLQVRERLRVHAALLWSGRPPRARGLGERLRVANVLINTVDGLPAPAHAPASRFVRVWRQIEPAEPAAGRFTTFITSR